MVLNKIVTKRISSFPGWMQFFCVEVLVVDIYGASTCRNHSTPVLFWHDQSFGITHFLNCDGHFIHEGYEVSSIIIQQQKSFPRMLIQERGLGFTSVDHESSQSTDRTMVCCGFSFRLCIDCRYCTSTCATSMAICMICHSICVRTDYHDISTVLVLYSIALATTPVQCTYTCTGTESGLDVHTNTSTIVSCWGLNESCLINSHWQSRWRCMNIVWHPSHLFGWVIKWQRTLNMP